MRPRIHIELIRVVLALTILCSFQIISGEINKSNKVLKLDETASTEIIQNESVYSTHTSRKDKLLKYLERISKSNKTISGVCVNYYHVQRHKGLEALRRIAGVFPGMIYTTIPSYNASVARWQEFIAETISDWKNGYLVKIRWPQGNPLISMDILKEDNETNWKDLITEDGNLNRVWKNELDALATYLRKLQNAGVVPICNILPSINDNDLLWDGRPGLNGSLKLYQITFDYLTQYHNLTSLIRVWSINLNGDMEELENYWPGDNYVDVVSVQMWNNEQPNMIDYENLLKVVGEKPISMDILTIPPPQLWDEQLRWAWFTVNDDYLRGIKRNSQEKVRMGFNDTFVINRESIDFFATRKSPLCEDWKNASDLYNCTLKHRLLNYFTSISGYQTVTGLYSYRRFDREIGLQTIKRITGNLPGVLTSAIPSYASGSTLWQSFVDETISNWNNGYFVHLIWHSNSNPLTSMGILKQGNDTAWNDLTNKNGSLNYIWKLKLDNLAFYLLQLQTAGVVPICNIFPWINSKTALWNGRRGLNGSAKLYRMTHDYLTRHHNLSSVIWVWSVNTTGGMARLEEFWPGNDYVDVASFHMWNLKTLNSTVYQKVLDLVGDTPISMDHIHKVPSTILLATQPRWAWFTATGDKLTSEYNKDEFINATFNSKYAINKDSNNFFIKEISDEHTHETRSSQNETLKSDKSSKSLSDFKVVVVASVSLVLILISTILAVVYFVRRKPRVKSTQSDSTIEKLRNNFFNGTKSMGTWNMNIFDKVESKPYDTRHEIQPNDIKIEWEHPLGSGAFGIVLRGALAVYVQSNAHARSVITVAVKTCKENEVFAFESINGMMSELKIMDYVGKHPYIVNLLGAITGSLGQGTFYLVLEYCEKGSLHKYLKDHKSNFVREGSEAPDVSHVNLNPITTSNLYDWSRQIISGMEHLALKQVIHGDLATRNVLLDSSLAVKLSDFGLSRRLYANPEYVKKSKDPLPWRWMAIEYIRDLTFSIQSDIWSFGVTLWEIFTLAATPFAMDIYDAKFVELLEDGYRLTQQEHISDDMFALMMSCWGLDPKQRPKFSKLAEMLDKMQRELMDDENQEATSHQFIYTDLQEA